MRGGVDAATTARNKAQGLEYLADVLAPVSTKSERRPGRGSDHTGLGASETAQAAARPRLTSLILRAI